MSHSDLYQRLIPFFVFGLLFASLYSSQSWAGMVSTESVITESQLAVDKQQLLSLVQTDEIKQQLQQHGITPEMAEQRIGNLTQSELVAFNKQLQDAPAGSGILGTLTVIFIVFVITDALCATDLFTFVNCIK